MKRHLRALLLPVVAAALLATASPARSGDAVAYQVNPQHSGFQPADALTPPLDHAWTRAFDQKVSYPLIANGLIFVTVADTTEVNYGTTLYALDPTTGATLWSHELGGPFPVFGISYDNGRIFAVNFPGVLTGFDALTGAKIWSEQLPRQYAFETPPVSADGNVYVAGAGNGDTLYCVDESDGSIRWMQDFVDGQGSPTLAKGNVYVAGPGPWAFAFASADGHRIWTHAPPGDGGGGETAPYADGKLWFRDWATGNWIFDASTGDILGSFDATAIPAFADHVGLFVADGVATATSTLTGTPLWRFVGDGRIQSSPLAVSDGSRTTAYFGSASGMVYGVDVATGSLVWQANAGAPILKPDMLDSTFLLPGLAAGEGLLAISASNTLVVYRNAVGEPPPVPQPPPPPPTNLLPNPSFEANLSGWTGSAATLSRRADGEDGAWAAKVTLARAVSTFGTVASPAATTAAAAGVVYRARGWIRSDAPGGKVCIVVREATARGLVRGAPACVTSTRSWQQLPAAQIAATARGDKIDVFVYETAPLGRNSFETDALTLLAG